MIAFLKTVIFGMLQKGRLCNWNVRYGTAIYANSPSERLLKSIESARKALKDGPTS